jgi:hypothetical protein
MRRWVAAVLAAVAGAGLASAVTAGVAHSAPPASPPPTLRLFERDTQQASIDLGDHGQGPGDLFVFAGDLTDSTATGPEVGRAAGSCTTTSGDAAKPGDLLCAITLTLRGGQIQTQAVYDSAALFGGSVVPWRSPAAPGTTAGRAATALRRSPTRRTPPRWCSSSIRARDRSRPGAVRERAILRRPIRPSACPACRVCDVEGCPRAATAPTPRF